MAVPAPLPPHQIQTPLLQIFMDGLLMLASPTGKTRPLQPGGALMLGAEQDCERWLGCFGAGWGRGAAEH